MVRKTTPAATPAPSAMPADLFVAGGAAGAPIPPDAQPPAKLSKLAAAMQVVSLNATSIEGLGQDIDELHRKYAPNTVFDLETKEGKADAEAARKESRAVRLKIQNLRDEGKSLLNSLKGELVTAAETDIARAQAIETNAKTQIEAHEQKEANRVKGHEDNIAAISLKAEGAATMSSDEIAQRLLEVEAIIVDDSYQEFEEKAKRKRREVVEVLVEAKAKAIQREHDARVAKEAADARERENEDLRKKEEARTRAKAKIDTMKALPDQVVGTDADNIREILRLHKAAVPDAEHYGDMLEFAEMAHELTATKLQKMLDEAVAAELPQGGPEELEADLGGDDSQWTEEQRAQIAEAGEAPLVFNKIEPLSDKPAAGDEPIDDAAESRLSIRTVAEQQALSTPQADPDPFTEPTQAEKNAQMAAAPAPRPAFRGGFRPVQAAPTPTPAPTPAPAPLEPSGDDVPDLLQAVGAALAEYDKLKVWPNSDAPLSMVLHGPFGDAMKNLRTAHDFTTEFAD